MRLKGFFKKYGISILILILVIYFLKDKITINDFAKAFAKTNILLYLIGIFLLSIPILLRALKYYVYLGDGSPSFFNLIKMVFFSIYLNSTLPARAGDMFLIMYLKNKDISLAKSTGAVFVERATDIITLLILVVVFSYLIGPQMSSLLGDTIKMASLLIIALLIMVVVVLWKKKFVAKIAKKLIKRYDFESFLIKFEEGIKLLAKKKKISGIYSTLSVFRWLGETPNYYFLMLAAGINVPFYYAIAYLCIIGLLWAVPFTPGGLGTVEAFTLLFFSNFGIAEPTIITFLVLIRSMLLVYIIPGTMMINKIGGDFKSALAKIKKEESKQ